MPNLTLEVGTEEMPAGAIASALEQLKAAIAKGLDDARLGDSSVEVWGTPRRLIVRALDVPKRQPDVEREARGPAKSVAFGPEGAPTGAAIGFAKKNGVPVESLGTVSTPQGEYVVARFTEQGKSSTEVLGGILSQAVLGLYFPKKMRWGGGALHFVRPIRWILCLLGDQVVPMEIGGVESGRKSRGHRFLAPEEFDLANADGLLDRLRAAFVLVDSSERERAIREQVEALARDAGGRIPWDTGLLDENVWLVEWPTAVLGSFDPQYLDLPRPVLVTAMKKHQRYFPVEGPDGSLLAHFVAIRSGGTDYLETVREGYERVLTARFSDAAYFHKLDRASSLDDMAGQLGRLIFQEKLGTMAEKRQRLMELTAAFAELFSLDREEREQLVRAASLAKADLVSRMVIELPALQGVMGREYALAAGEAAPVANAIAEHYQPRSASDSIPASRLGRLLALADRVDTLTGYLGIGVMPSGSSDPYGLRRAAQGVVQILAHEDDGPSPLSLSGAAADVYRDVNHIELTDTVCDNLHALLLQRLDSALEEQALRYDLREAAVGAKGPFALIVDAVIARGAALGTLAGDARFVPTVQAAARVSNILKSGTSTPSAEPRPRPVAERVREEIQQQLSAVSPDRFDSDAERSLLVAIQALEQDTAEQVASSNYIGLFDSIQSLNGPVNRFFDDVMVMADDEHVRANRLSLLRAAETLYRVMADWTKIVLA